MFKAELKTRYRTKYELSLIDSRTNKVKQRAVTHNTFLTNWWNSSPNEYCNSRLVETIYMGDGSGTPSMADTGLFHQLWGIAPSETQTIDLEHSRITFVATATFPATSSYVGTLTEIGCTSRCTATGNGQWPAVSTLIFTHALLKDAEGNPMTITKTDTDKLIVVVTIEVSYATSAPWKLVKRPGYIGKRTAAGEWATTQWTGVRFLLGTTTPDADCWRVIWSPVNHSFRGPSAGASDTPLAGGSLDKNTLKMSFANTRIGQAVGQNRPIYYNYVIFEGFIYAELPNPDLFPYYWIEDIAIGTGDGSTAVFHNPLNYFVEDSETIYINDVPLVRNVDYTIDYKNNAQRLPELAATKNCKLSGGFTIAAGQYTDNGPNRVPFRRFLTSLSRYNFDTLHTGWIASAPLIIELEQAEEVNTFYVPGWVSAGTITLYSSADGETWNQVCQISHASNVANLETFTSVISQYWKIEGTNTGWNGRVFTSDDMSIELFLGYVGNPNIVFTTPPAEGDVITMKVQMDRPFKNGNFVIDASAILQLS